MRMLVTGLSVVAALGATALAAPPAAAVSLTCISADASCQTFTCPSDAVEVVNTGFTDTGPWVVICRPRV
jgi:hypothetical protein